MLSPLRKRTNESDLTISIIIPLTKMIRTTTTATHPVDPLRAENERKDVLIMRLKAELFEMRQKDRDYKLLHETFV